MREPVTIIIPTYNEESHIEGVLECLERQTYGASNLEVLVVDGRSTDRTRSVVESWSDRLDVHVIDNPLRRQAPALNLGLSHASNDLIVRLDGHAWYADDYVAMCVDALATSDAAVVGGPMQPLGSTWFGRAVALATTTPIGVGPGRFHYSREREYVDTVWLGAFRRTTVLEVGGYDENLRMAAEDAELNMRITRAGGRILLDPSIESRYVPRSTVRSLAMQYHNYGLGKASTLRKHRSLPTWRPIVPAAFVAALVAAPVFWVLGIGRPLVLAMLAVYGVTVLGAAIAQARTRLTLVPGVVTAIVVMHVSYGVGFIRGVLERSTTKTHAAPQGE